MIAEDDLDIACTIFKIARRSADMDDVKGAIAEIIATHRREHRVKGAKSCRDAVRMDWLCKHTEFRFNIFDSATKKFLRENHAMGCVIRPVVDAAMEKYPNP